MKMESVILLLTQLVNYSYIIPKSLCLRMWPWEEYTHQYNYSSQQLLRSAYVLHYWSSLQIVLIFFTLEQRSLQDNFYRMSSFIDVKQFLRILLNFQFFCNFSDWKNSCITYISITFVLIFNNPSGVLKEKSLLGNSQSSAISCISVQIFQSQDFNKDESCPMNLISTAPNNSPKPVL